jgi:hypothetical protein
MSLSIRTDLDDAICEFQTETLALYNTDRSNDNDHKSIIITQKLKEWIEEIKELNALDIALQNGIKNMTINETDIIGKEEFPRKLKSIRDDVLIIYIKNAQVYRKYKLDDLNEFRNHNNTVYRHNGPIYEVSRDSHKQKLMIVLADDEDNRLELMQGYIIDFLKKYPRLGKTKNSDISIFQNGCNIEFLVNNIQLSNLDEKQEFIDDFVMFMHKKGEFDIAQKIQLRPPPSAIKGVKFYELPLNKQPLKESTADILDQLITTAANNNVPVVNVVVNNIVNIDNSVRTNNTTINNNSEQKTTKSFCKYLYDERPEWYLENKYVDIEIISNAYVEYFGYENIARSSISRLLKGKIFNNGMRTKGVTSKKLFTFAHLKKQL